MYYVYLDNCLMPVTPGKMVTSVRNRNTTVDLVSGGQINILKSPGLSEVSFDLLFPAVKYPFAVYENDTFKSPSYYLEKIETLKTQKRAFDFIVIRTISAEELLKYSAKISSLPSSAFEEYDLNGDGRITAADARILLRSESGRTIINDTNMRVAIEDYKITEDADNHGRDFLVSLTLKQAPEYALKTASYSISG